MLKGCLKNSKEWTEEEKDLLKKIFNNSTYAEMSEKLNRSDSAIRHMANRMGLKKESHRPINPYKKYYYNQLFFNDIKTEEQAYWLGFIAADGNIYISKTTNSISIELAIRDIEHLKKFNKSINGNIEVQERIRPSHSLKSGRIIRETKTCLIRLYSNQMSSDLINLGIVPDKTHQHKDIPVFKNELLDIAFLRGYFDGNGSIHVNKKTKSLIMDITSPNKKYLEYWRLYLFENYNITSYIICEDQNKVDSTMPCFKLVFRGLTNTYNLGQLIYNNSNIYLSRKYNIYKRYLFEYNVKERIKNIPPGKYITSSIASLISND